jgi:preprotein translocase subunit SecD
VAKGFAVTLILGVLVSMFTAITVTRTFLRPFIGTDMGKNISLFAPYQRKKNV